MSQPTPERVRTAIYKQMSKLNLVRSGIYLFCFGIPADESGQEYVCIFDYDDNIDRPESPFVTLRVQHLTRQQTSFGEVGRRRFISTGHIFNIISVKALPDQNKLAEITSGAITEAPSSILYGYAREAGRGDRIAGGSISVDEGIYKALVSAWSQGNISRFRFDSGLGLIGKFSIRESGTETEYDLTRVTDGGSTDNWGNEPFDEYVVASTRRNRNPLDFSSTSSKVSIRFHYAPIAPIEADRIALEIRNILDARSLQVRDEDDNVVGRVILGSSVAREAGIREGSSRYEMHVETPFEYQDIN